MKKVKDAAFRVLFHSFMVTLAIMAIRDGSEGAMRVLTFISWARFFAVIIAASGRQSAERDVEFMNRISDRLIPAWITKLVSIAIGLALIWNGSIATGIALVLAVAFVDAREHAITKRSKSRMKFNAVNRVSLN